MKRLAAVLTLAMLASPALAVRPDEMLADPALEQRARALSQGLRCLVCRNESIDDSDADLAHDLRVLLRDRLTAGDSDAQAVDYIVARYGEFVLLNPTTRGANLILWGAGPAALLAGAFLAFSVTRRRARAADVAELSAEDQARVKALLEDTPG
jgi:cytochrome c-type biogenesis protein CcmH